MACDLRVAIRQRHGDARHVYDLRERASMRNANGFEQASGGVGGKREHDAIRIVG